MLNPFISTDIWVSVYWSNTRFECWLIGPELKVLSIRSMNRNPPSVSNLSVGPMHWNSSRVSIPSFIPMCTDNNLWPQGHPPNTKKPLRLSSRSLGLATLKKNHGITMHYIQGHWVWLMLCAVASSMPRFGGYAKERRKSRANDVMDPWWPTTLTHMPC